MLIQFNVADVFKNPAENVALQIGAGHHVMLFTGIALPRDLVEFRRQVFQNAAAHVPAKQEEILLPWQHMASA